MVRFPVALNATEKWGHSLYFAAIAAESHWPARRLVRSIEDGLMFLILYVTAHQIGSVIGPLPPAKCKAEAIRLTKVFRRGIFDPLLTEADRRFVRGWRFICKD